MNLVPTKHHLFAIALLFGTGGCSSLRSFMLGGVSSSMARGAALSFQRESDPILAAEAMPFALKTLDAMALQQPDRPEIQLAAAAAYIQYSGAFLDWEARKCEDDDPAGSHVLRQRAARLHLRGRDYAAAALRLSPHELIEQWITHPETWTSRFGRNDVPAMYWLGAGWASAISSDPSNLKEVARLPLIESLMRRALALDPGYGDGSLHEFFILYEGGRSPSAGGNLDSAEEHFRRAIALSRGYSASPYVAMATTVAINQQDEDRFQSLLQEALGVDPEAAPDLRLANAIAQEKARWYLDHMEAFILPGEVP